MEPDPQEPDWDAIWRRISIDAKIFSEQREEVARWAEKASFDADAIYAAQRRASRAWIKETIQSIDLANTINQGDYAGYVERWYPEATPNGPRPGFVSYDEYALLLEEDTVNKAAIWRRIATRAGQRRESEAGTPVGYVVSTWEASAGRVGPRSRLREWARRVLRRHRPLR